MKLYEIDQRIEECVVYDDDGNIVSVDAEKLNALELERQEKIEGVACWMKSLAAEAVAVKAEKMKLEKRQKALENRAEGLKEWIQYALNGEKLKTPRVNIYYGSTQKAVVTDREKVPEDFRVMQDWKPDLDGLKRAMKAGELFDGVELVDSPYVVIK